MLILQETLYLKCDLAQFTPEIFLTILRYQRHFLRNWGKLKIACHKLYSSLQEVFTSSIIELYCVYLGLLVIMEGNLNSFTSWILVCWQQPIPLDLKSSFCTCTVTVFLVLP